MRTVMVTAGFCSSRLLAESWVLLYGRMKHPVEHHFLYNHYPLREEENRADLMRLCKKYGVKWFDSLYDRGLHGSLNNWARTLELDDDDIIVCHDPDANAGEGDWLNDLVRVASVKDVAICAMNLPGVAVARWDGLLIPLEVDGVRYWGHPAIEMVDISAWKWGFVRQAGGFSQTYAYYGGIESAMYPHMQRLGLHLAYLRDRTENIGMFDHLRDPEYQAWKAAHLAGFVGGFREWIEKSL